MPAVYLMFAGVYWAFMDSIFTTTSIRWLSIFTFFLQYLFPSLNINLIEIDSICTLPIYDIDPSQEMIMNESLFYQEDFKTDC